MNRAVPPGDCGNRKADPKWPSRFTRTLPRSFGLVGRVEAAAQGTGTATTREFIGIKHGGFERLLLETLCATTAVDKCS